jgi:hypothetical protein
MRQDAFISMRLSGRASRMKWSSIWMALSTISLTCIEQGGLNKWWYSSYTGKIAVESFISIKGVDFSIKIVLGQSKIDINCNFWYFDYNLIYLSYCNHLIQKKYTDLFVTRSTLPHVYMYMFCP